MTHDIYHEKIRMLACISKLTARYVRATKSAGELERLVRFSGELLMAVECDPPTTFSVALPESAFAARADGLKVCGQRDFYGACSRIKGHDGNCQDFLRDMPCQPATKGDRP